MRRNRHEYLQAETGWRLEAMLQRFAGLTEVTPWLRPELGYSELRRTAERLRSGAIRGMDPRIPGSVLADLIEKAIVQDMIVKTIAAEGRDLQAIFGGVRREEEVERQREFVAGFHQLKKSPEASNPESPEAGQVRHLHRVRRNEHGRSRKRKKKG